MIHSFSSLPISASRAAVLGAFFLGASLANASAAPAKTKIAVKKAAPFKGLMLEGDGVCTFRATINAGTSNVTGAAFTAIGRGDNERRTIVSTSKAMVNNGYSVVVNFVEGRRAGDLGPPRRPSDIEKNRPESESDRERRLKAPTSGFTITFSSPGGFKKGQVIPVRIPKPLSKPAAMCLIGFKDVVRIEGREVVDGRGNRRRSGRNTQRFWEAVSGTFRVESLTSERVTFSLRDVRFVVPEFGRGLNAATGSFVMQGTGESTLNEVD